MDEQLYPRKYELLRENGELFIREYTDETHYQDWHQSRVALVISATDISYYTRNIHKEEKDDLEDEAFKGNGVITTRSLDNLTDIVSVQLFGTDREALKGSFVIRATKPENVGISFFVQEKRDIHFPREEGWSLSVNISEGEFNEIHNALRQNRLNSLTIAFNTGKHGNIFQSNDDLLYYSYFSLKLGISDILDDLCAQYEFELPPEWQEDEDVKDFTLSIEQSKTELKS